MSYEYNHDDDCDDAIITQSECTRRRTHDDGGDGDNVDGEGCEDDEDEDEDEDKDEDEEEEENGEEELRRCVRLRGVRLRSIRALNHLS